MKIKRFCRLTALLCALALTLSLSPAAGAAGSPAVSNNSRTFGYGIGQQYCDSPTTSYLFENPQGNLTRVEYIKELPDDTWIETIVVEDYTPDFQLLSSRTIPMELSRWGGFFAGETYNFFIFGQNNPNESDSVEVIRVVKYDKNWNRLGHASLYGAYTYSPFAASAVDCAEYGDMLYIRTGHTMYHSNKDGLNHQASMSFSVQESTMTIPAYIGDPLYVSHSFKQLILVDSEGNILGADHGDGYPRAFRLGKYQVKAGSPLTWTGNLPICVVFQDFPGTIGQNSTGGKLLGLEEVTGGYVLTYIYNINVYTAYIAKQDLTEYEEKDVGTAKITKITDYTYGKEPNAYGAAMVSTGLSGGYVIWTNLAYDRIFYTTYAADGSAGTIQGTTDGRLSDCQPIMYNGRAVWYQTEGSVPTFYALDGSGLTVTPANGTSFTAQSYTPEPESEPEPEPEREPGIPRRPASGSAASLPFTDVAANSPYRDAIAWAVEWGITNGTSSTTFSPDAPCTQSQVITFLYRAAGSPNKGSDEWASALDWADDYYITYASRDTPCTRMAAVTYLWLAQAKPKANISVSFTDVNPQALQSEAVAWAVEQGITNGTSPTTFSPSTICTRGQIVTFLYRALS